MPSLSLKIVQDEGAVTKKVKLDSHMTVKEAHKVVKDKVNVANKGQEYALFLRSADDDMTGVWLEDDRTLDYYLLRDGDSLDYICRMRNLRVRLLDDTVKTLPVDEAKTVGELMMDICARIGIKNYDEYGLCKEEVEETEDGKEVKEPSGGGFTLKRPKPAKERDVILEQMSKRLKTDDNVEWLDQHRTIREQGIDFKETLLLKRRLFYSDRNVDSRDPVQLHLLYVQTRDAILKGRHPVTEQQAVNFAGLQCQIQLGDYDEKKHKPGFIEKLEEYLPAQYLNAWSVEKKIMKEYATHQGKTELEAKFLYIKTARAMPTYGVTFFLVKEKQKDKKKLVPRLLGINAEAILRLDEVTKEILQQWPLTHVKTYHAGKSQTFTLNFGDYSDKEYSVKTQDCHRIRDILEGYIDIIRRRMLAKPCADPGESMAICHDNVQQGKSHLIQHISNNPSKIVTESFVGPTKLEPYDQGSHAQSGTMITTVQQIVVTDHLQNQQQALKGEMPLRGDMSKDCIRKLNRLNSNSVKIVGLLTNPTETHIKDAQQIVWTMKEDFPVVEQGVKETADKQTIDDAKKMLLDELQDLNNFLNKLTGSLEPGKINPNDAKDAAESIADLTTQMYFSIDPKTKRRSELLRRSRKSFRDGEKTEQTIRRASFIAAATTALHSVDTAAQALHEDYTGPKLSEEEQKKLEKALEDRLGKLNAAIALYLMAHSDPDNIDYPAAINSMNAINELMPKLARDAQVLASTKDPAARKKLQDEMRTLFDATKTVCGMTGNQDHEKMQEASNQYADVAGRLLYKFSNGNNADKENEIVQLAKDVGAKVSSLLVTTNELTCQAKGLPASSEVDAAGVRTAGAARDLLHSAQLTAPAIHEPHCQSALTAAAANLSSAVHQLESTWRPVVEDPTRQHMADLLHTRANDVAKALDRLRDAYGNLEGDEDDAMLPQKEKRRLKFITTLSGAKNRLQGVKFDEWNKLPPSGADAPSEQEKAAAQRRLEQKMAQLNAAVAALAAATADRNNPDYDTAELALSTITELMPKIAKDMEIASKDKDEATRNAMQTNLCAMCDAAQEICEGDGYQQAQGEPLTKFADASSKLVFLVSPSADRGKQKYIIDLSAAAHQQASELVSRAQDVAQAAPGAAGELGERACQTHDDAQALRSVAQVTAASIAEDRCRDALSSAVSKLQGSADMLNSSCQAQQSPQLTQHCAAVNNAHSKLSDSLGKLADVCDMDAVDNSPAQQEKQRLQFVQSMSGAKRRLDAAAQQLTKPMACHVMTEEHAAVLEQQLASRLAQLNAAVAALAAATADRENPNYIAAEQAVKDITSLMPHVVQDSRKLCGTKNSEGQAAILQDIRALCDASKELCDSAGQPQGLADAAARFTAASRNLMFFASPGADNDKENEVIGLSADACGKASQLLSQVQQLTKLVPDADAAAELDSRGSRAADAAQALLTIAQATAPTIANANCQRELISAAEKLRSTASDLTSSCQPHLDKKPEMKQQVLGSQKQLDDSLDKLIEFCKSAGGTQSTISPAEKEKRRLKFINSLTGAKNRLYESEQQLKQPLTRQSLIPEDAAALEHRLSDRLAQLNAAVAALAAAKADPANPDYAAAEKAVKEISELMPLIVQDSRKLSSIKEPAAQTAMLEDLKALCQASRTICENTENSPKVNTTDFNKAASKLVYLVSPAADKKKGKQVLDLSEAACKQASDYLSAVQSTSEQLGPVVAAQISPAGARVHDAADNLHAVALAASPSISEPSCSAAVVSAAETLRSTASDLTASCGPHMQQTPEMKQKVLSSQRQLADSLDKLVSACQPGLSGNLIDVPSDLQQEKQRLKFISSVSGAKDRLDAAEKQLQQPMICQMMRQEDGAAMERKLSNRLAELNAAIAALAAATADREHPDYAAADRAVRTITELMPQVVKESHTLCGTKTGEEQAAMLQDLQALCAASREICDSAGQPQGLTDAAAKFSAASGKLVYIVSPKTQDAHEKQVMALSAASCGKASELLTQVQRLTELVPDAAQAAELDSRGARAADAAQALLTVALATTPTIGDPLCQKELISAAEKLRSTASDLTSSCQPHFDKKPEMKQQVLGSQKQLDDSLDKLVQACKKAQQGNLVDVPSAQQQEKQRLKFISSLSGAKNRLDLAELQLQKPMKCETSSLVPHLLDEAAIEHKLSNRLAQLNAAVAALAAATADRERPDYAAADRAVKTITELMPKVVQDSRTLCGTKTGQEQAAMLQDLRALCEASREICDSAGQPQGLSDAAAKFSAASGKLLYVVSPGAQDAHEKQVTALSAASCGKASELLSQVQRLTELVPDAAQAAELDSRGARAADAAQALLTVALATASTIGDSHCQKELISAAEKLRSTASDLTSSCAPHLTDKPEIKQQVLNSQKQLDDSLDKLVQASKAAQHAHQEKHRLKFISSVSGVKNHFAAAEKQLKEPLQTQTKQADPATLQHRLADRLAQLNAAVAALAAATADREQPDYAAAHQAMESIPKVLREVIHESRALSATKDGPGAAAMTENLRALCEASREICENAGHPQGLGDAAAKYSAASAKMMVVAGPDTHSAHGKQVIDLAAASSGKAGELLSQVKRVTELVPDAAQAAELNCRGARAADAAQGLLNVAQITASSISNPDCDEQVISAAEMLRSTASDLTSSCAPHLTHKPEIKQQVSSSQKQLDDSLDKLVQACKIAQEENTPSAQQEKHRLKFISSVSGVKNHIDAAEKQLKEPLQTQTKQADPATLQHRLADRLAQLNAAVAALAAATADRERPDFATAHRAVESIPKLLREVIHESRALSATKDGPGAAAMTEDLKALCEASREICENAGHPQGLGDAAAKFSAASGKMIVAAGPKTHSAQEKQLIDLSAASCGKASELLSQVQRLTELVSDSAAAAELDYRGARAADSAQGLLNVVQITASSISEPGCADQLISAAEKLRTTAGELTSSCAPHLTDKPEMKQQVLSSQKQLDDSLDKLVTACKTARQGGEVVLSPQQEKLRIKFVSSVSGAKKHLDTAEQQMTKPVVIQNLKQADSATLQHQLSRRLAQLNAAVAALAAATQDGKNPDYPAAERAVTTVIELMPQVVHDSHTLCGTKDTAEQAAMLKHLRELCDASRAICDSAGQPKKLNEASAKLANASGKLVYIVSPEGAQGSKPAVPVRRAPPPTPARDPKLTTAQAVRSSVHADATQHFLDTLRGEESQDKAKIVAVDAKKTQAIEEEKRAYKQFCEMIDSAEKGLKTAEDSLKVLHSTKTTSGKPLAAVEVARREQHMEDSLARAGVQVAALVAANYADKLDYKAAMEPTIFLTEAVKSVVNDGSAIYSSLPEQTRKPFVEDMAGLCQATKSICDAAKSKEEVKKLNDAAISFGDKSVKLLRVVSCNIDPALEKQVISRAKAIGDTASRLALEASSVASNANSSAEGQTHVQDICTAGASCVDAAGKLVYTAKLIAPTIHHATCQDTLVSSADSLSTSLTKFSKTWAPLASSQQPTVQKLTQEAAHLEDLVEKLRKDVKSGKLGKRREMEQIVNLDSPLRKMTVQIIETAKSISEYGEMPAEQKKEYVNYSDRLEEAIRALDLANARSQRAPHDRNKRDELDIATQDLQVTLLQTRPSRAGQEQNNIVDFRDFLQDLVKEAWELKSIAKKNEGPAGKRTTDDIKLLSSKISEDASKLLNPSDNFGDGVTVMNSVDDIMDIDMFGQECDVIVKEINSAIQGIHDQKAKQALRAKALPLTESCHLLRFAVNSHIMATKSLAYDDALESLDNFKSSVMHPLAKEAARSSQKEKKAYSSSLGSDGCCRRASSSLLRARQRALLGEPQALGAAVTYVAAAAVHQPRLLHCGTRADVEETPQVAVKDMYMDNLGRIMDMTHRVTVACQRSESKQCPAVDVVYSADAQAQSVIKELNDLDYMISSRKIKSPVLNAEDIDKLLMCKRQPVEGTPKQLEDKLHQLSTKLSSMSGTVILSVKKPESLARSLHAAADVATQLANTARALEDSKRPVQCKRIEEAAHEMCLATYSLLKTSELVCQDPNHHDARRKLQDACRNLNDSINKLVRSVNPSGRVNQECGEVHRSLQLQRSLLQASPQPCGALPYVHCVDTLQSQRDVLQKLNSDQAMSREEFLKSLNYVASAVSNSTECAAQAAYLISVSEKDQSIGKEGIVDVAKLHKAVGAIEETCVSIIMANHEEQVKEETAILKVQVKDLQQGIDDGIKKTKEGELREMLKACRNEINKSSISLFSAVQGNPNDKDEIISKVMDLMDDVNDASGLIEHPDLVPTAGEVSAETQKHIDEVMKSSLALLTNTEELIKQVKAAPEEPEVMKWVMFNKRKDVLDAFENLLKNVKTSGQRVKLIEGSTDDSEEEKKSYVQKQFDSASKWLTKSVSKAEVKTNGQQAVRNLIEVANKVTVDLKGSDKEDMKNLVVETEQLLTECSKKYDHEQYSVLMERVRELKKGIERGVVTRVVEDFIDAEAPLADLELVDYEKDESKRKFLLEKKIAELLAQLSRVTKTARLIADTDKDAGTTVSTQLNSCSEQAELLAPMLVKAAEQRVASPDDKAVIENYKALLTRYAESLSKIRDLCDQSVDPMEFVQTAGETMERMREESTKHNDPMKCAHTSTAITKLANRVIHVSLSSSSARADPELARALAGAQAQLAAATPAADTRASRMPDWKDHTAKILQATGQVESLLGGENVFMNQPGPDQPIYNEALNLHVAIRDWSSRDNEIVAVAKRMAVLMAKLSNFMSNDKQREVLATSKSIVTESHEVTRLAKKLAHECTDHRIKTNLLQTCERIPTISGQLKMLTTVKGFSLGRHGTQEDKEALDMLVGNAQSLMMSIQDVVKGAASASVKIMSQRGPRMKWVRKTVY